MAEKLMVLIGQVQDCGCDVTDVVKMKYVENNTLVDHLINNDVVPVVRCKDCKYYELHKCHNNANGWFSHRTSDDFCSYGERREGE